MQLTVSIAAFGTEATERLRQTIAVAQLKDRLSPVTVVVPSNYAGLSLRRQLAAEAALVNVRFLVFGRLAELLGAPSLSRELRPLTPWIRAEAARMALAAHIREHPDSRFIGVSSHAATGESLEATFSDLRDASPETLAKLAHGSQRAREVVAVFERYQQLVRGSYYDETDLAEAGAGAVRSGSPSLRDVGHVILYLPRKLELSETRLLQALGEVNGATAILGRTGEKVADINLHAMELRLSAAAPQLRLESPSPPEPSHIVAVPDADEEVGAAIRMAMERASRGVPLHRIAFLYPNAAVYGPLVHERLQAAGIPHNGPAVATLAQSIAGRFLLGMLRLPATNFRRDAVMDWLTAGPIIETERGGVPPIDSWDGITREAGVVAGLPQWLVQLERYVRRQGARLVNAERPVSEGQATFIRRQIAGVPRLQAFIEGLAAALTPPTGASWDAHVEWATALLERYMGGHGDFRGCPDEARLESERNAYEQVMEQISNLRALDSVALAGGGSVDAPSFVQALERLLASPAQRVGPFGTGIFSGPIASATAMDFDVVFILGMVEGLVPTLERDDPLLPDLERARADASLPHRTDRRAEGQRDYLAALASASSPGSERILVTSAADLRGQKKRLPSRWLIKSAGALAGRPSFATSDFLAIESAPWLTRVESFQAALRKAVQPGSAQEYDLRLMLGGRSGEAAMSRIEPSVRAGTQTTKARAGSDVGRFEGVIGPQPELRPSAATPTSPTALQTWATCPFSYFLKSVLHVGEREDPEDILVLSAAERGNIIHDTLDQFMKANKGWRGPWEARHLEQILEMGDARCQLAEADGITGKPLLWGVERQRIRRDLEGFIEADAVQRANGYAFLAGEYAFGMGAGGPGALEIQLPDGSSIAFRGRIDRVDHDPGSGALAIYDYKSGSTTQYKQMVKDHLKGGQLLQLPIYALAASEGFGAGASTWASYWFVTRRGEYAHIGYIVSDEDLADFKRKLNLIADGIGAGNFPANPGVPNQWTGRPTNCSYCPYHRLCPSDRQRAWRRKQDSPAVLAYLELTSNDGASEDD
ncbi:MAG: PD-(D/E)XK nuclease family protein [Tepidiformaceae bacterium]